MRDLKFYQNWLDYDGQTVSIDGLKCVLKVRTQNSVYPRKQVTISVDADPVNKKSKKYLAIRSQLGDDWSTDVLSLGPEEQSKILEKLT